MTAVATVILKNMLHFSSFSLTELDRASEVRAHYLSIRATETMLAVFSGTKPLSDAPAIKHSVYAKLSFSAPSLKRMSLAYPLIP